MLIYWRVVVLVSLHVDESYHIFLLFLLVNVILFLATQLQPSSRTFPLAFCSTSAVRDSSRFSCGSCLDGPLELLEQGVLVQPMGWREQEMSCHVVSSAWALPSKIRMWPRIRGLFEAKKNERGARARTLVKNTLQGMPQSRWQSETNGKLEDKTIHVWEITTS